MSIQAQVPASAITGTLDGDRFGAPTVTKRGGVKQTGTPSGLFLKDDDTWGTPAGGSGGIGAYSAFVAQVGNQIYAYTSAGVEIDHGPVASECSHIIAQAIALGPGRVVIQRMASITLEAGLEVAEGVHLDFLGWSPVKPAANMAYMFYVHNGVTITGLYADTYAVPSFTGDVIYRNGVDKPDITLNPARVYNCQFKGAFGAGHGTALHLFSDESTGYGYITGDSYDIRISGYEYGVKLEIGGSGYFGQNYINDNDFVIQTNSTANPLVCINPIGHADHISGNRITLTHQFNPLYNGLDGNYIVQLCGSWNILDLFEWDVKSVEKSVLVMPSLGGNDWSPTKNDITVRNGLVEDHGSYTSIQDGFPERHQNSEVVWFTAGDVVVPIGLMRNPDSLVITPDSASAVVAAGYPYLNAPTAGKHTGGTGPSTNISASAHRRFKILVDWDNASNSSDYRECILSGTLTSGALIAAAMQTAIRAWGGCYSGVTVVYTTVYTITSANTGAGSRVLIAAGSQNDVCPDLKIGTANTGVNTAGNTSFTIKGTNNESAHWLAKLNDCNLTGLG